MRLCNQQGDFARKSMVAPVEMHLTPELTCNYVLHNARAEAAVRGGVTDGPPDSTQRKPSRPSAISNHAISTRPAAADSAPYFAALVASSCNVIAIA